DEGKAGDLYAEAHRILRRLIKARPGDPVGLKYLAKIEQAWKQWDQASKLWKQYQDICPDDPDSFRSLAGMHLRDGERHQALPLLEAAWQRDNADATLARQAGE